MQNFTKLLLVGFLFILSTHPAKAQHVYAYITNSGNNTMSIIDVGTGTVIGTVTLAAGTNPYAVTVLSNGDAYIANNLSGNVTIFSTTNNAIIGNITVGANPLSIAASPDGSKVYVTNSGDGTVSVISTATNTVTATITTFGNPAGVAFSPDGTKAYVADGVANYVVINTATNAIITTISTGLTTLPKGIAVTPDGQYIYEVNSNTSTVGVYKTIDNSNVATISVAASPYGIAISPDGTKAYVTSTSGTISVISTASNTVTSTIADGGGNQPLGVSFTPDGSKAYVVNFGASNVWVINAATDAVTGSPIVVGSSPSSFSSFIVNLSSPLPVHFTTFNAIELPSHSVRLNWNVVSETDGTYYDVLASNDGVSFSRRATITSDLHANGSYSWTDLAPAAGMNFYRIKSVETSGLITYSQVMRLTIGSSLTQTFVYPNPVKDKTFTLQISNQPKGVYSFDVVNMAGQKVYRSQVNYNGGSTAQTVNLPQALKRGIYQVVVTNGSNKQVFKLMVE
jgi:YVTN family beta-propeller protein